MRVLYERPSCVLALHLFDYTYAVISFFLYLLDSNHF